MVSGFQKSRSLKRISVRSTKGTTTTHYRKGNRSIARCAETKKPLRGIPRLTNKKFSKLNKSRKTVSRPFGGNLSHKALKDRILKEMVFEKKE